MLSICISPSRTFKGKFIKKKKVKPGFEDHHWLKQSWGEGSEFSHIAWSSWAPKVTQSPATIHFWCIAIDPRTLRYPELRAIENTQFLILSKFYATSFLRNINLLISPSVIAFIEPWFNYVLDFSYLFVILALKILSLLFLSVFFTKTHIMNYIRSRKIFVPPMWRIKILLLIHTHNPWRCEIV